MKIIDISYWHSPVGELVIGDFEGKLCLLDYRYRKMREKVDRRLIGHLAAKILTRKSALHRSVIAQLEEYFRGDRKNFDIELLFAGSKFQSLVWHELQKIPFGETISYGELALRVGHPTASRAVAAANGANAIAIMVPCHRVVAKNGELTGYGGGLSAKRKLLALESGKQQMRLF